MKHRLYRSLLATMTLLLLGAVLAQEADAVPIDPALWFSDWKVGVLAIVGFVHWLRLKFPKIDGPIAVPAVALAVGAVGGVLGQLFHLLTVAPFADLSFPWGGLGYGLALAVTGVIGVNVFQLLAGKLGQAVTGLLTKGDPVAADSTTATDAARAHLRR